jgi:hypothetical protein
MNANEVKKEFARYLATRGEAFPNMTPAPALEAVLSFYRDVRAEECDPAAGQDMLLFQWGTYDWGKGKHFELDITRQFMFEDGEDEDIWQFHVTFKFHPTQELVDLKSGNRWCESPEDLPSFASFVRGHPASAAVGSRTDGQPSLEYECAG